MKRSLVMMAIVALATPSFAAQGGTSTAPFLRIGQGARAEAMGGAFTAVADDAHAAHFNPAGLAQITKRKLALDHLEFIEEITTEHASYVQPFNATNGSLGVDVTFVDMGTIEKFDTTPVSLGEADITAKTASLSWGQAVGDRFALGVSGKFISQDLAGESDSTFAGDGGLLLFLVPDKFALGATIQNIGAKMKIGTAEEDLPVTYRGGGVFYVLPRKLLFSADVEKERDTDAIMHLGGEYIYLGRFAIRGGWRDTLEAKGGFSVGGGYIWRPDAEGDFFSGKDSGPVDAVPGLVVRFDYAFVDYGDFDATHRFGVHLSF
jgi:hypothetical protein